MYADVLVLPHLDINNHNAEQYEISPWEISSLVIVNEGIT